MSTRGFGVPFEESNKKDDLPFGSGGERIPLFWWRAGSRGEGSAVEGNWPGEVNAVGLDNVSHEGGHGHASVLDFGLTQEGNGGVVGVAPDGGAGELQWVVELDNII